MTTATFGTPPADDRTDPDLDAAGAGSFLDEIMAELDADPALATTVEIEVPGRPGYAIRARLDFNSADMTRWTNAAKSTDGNLDGVKYNTLCVGATTTAILRHGAEFTIGRGPAAFTNPEFQDMLGCKTVAETVRKFYGGREASISAAAHLIFAKAGWGDEATVVDPTTTTDRLA